MSARIFAVPSVDAEDITKGKRYAVTREEPGGLFIVHDDVGYPIKCLWDGCAHLNGASWEREDQS